MIAVAILGAFLAVGRLVYFWRHYQALAQMHASKEYNYFQMAQQLTSKRDWAARQVAVTIRQPASTGGGSWNRLTVASDSMTKDLQRLASYESRLKRKYQDAARHPWLPVSPDPPEPK